MTLLLATVLTGFQRPGVVAVVGDFGSGKSVNGERVHLKDIARYSDDADQPIPVFLRARQVQGSLENSVKQHIPSGTEVDRNGIRFGSRRPGRD